MDWKNALENLRESLPEADDQSPEPSSQPSADAGNDIARCPRLQIVYERKGRKGKEATIIAGFTLSDERVAEIASRLKTKLGVGGSARGGEILIQGDKRAQLPELLRQMGFKV